MFEFENVCVQSVGCPDAQLVTIGNAIGLYVDVVSRKINVYLWTLSAHPGYYKTNQSIKERRNHTL